MRGGALSSAATAALLALIGLAVAACGRQAPTVLDPPVRAPVRCPPASRLATPGLLPSLQRRAAIPADFHPTEVLRCRTEARRLPDRGGRWLVLVEERATGGLDRLLAQLRRPSAPRSRHFCAAVLIPVPYFVLIDASGRVIAPAVPTDGCRHPRRSALDALDALPYRTVSVTPIRQVESAGAAATGCAQEWKDVVLLQRPRPGAARPLWDRPVGRLKVCLYRVTSAGGLPTGEFAAGGTLAGPRLRPLLRALDAAPAAVACHRRHTRFAVLHPRAGGVAYVEADGCRRLLRPDGSLGRLDAATVRRLTGVR